MISALIVDAAWFLFHCADTLVGDWIETKGQGIEGVVEEVGFRSTRIRTFSKSLVTVGSHTPDFPQQIPGGMV